jgi:fructoselysine-6-P-deglycase FrlB-like protein
VAKHIEVRYPTDSLVASEIAQQPALWPTTLERVASAGIAQRFEGLPVVLTGAGTSAYAAQAIADAWPGARAIPTGLLLQSAAEVELAVPPFAAGGLLISLARSGDSPESAAVVERIKKLFPAVKHLAIVCNAEGRLAHTPGVQAICLDPRTNDRSLAMTSSFSTPIVCFASSDTRKRRYEKELVEDLSERGLGKIAVIGDNACSLWQHDWFVQAGASALPDCLRTPFEIPFAHLLAYHLSLHALVDPDNPSPGGAITRVVKAFSIHEDSGGA